MSTAGDIDATAFVAFQAGWERRASAYDDFLAPIISRAIGPLLDAARVVRATPYPHPRASDRLVGEHAGEPGIEFPVQVEFGGACKP
jgi:hypothetical protein